MFDSKREFSGTPEIFRETGMGSASGITRYSLPGIPVENLYSCHFTSQVLVYIYFLLDLLMNNFSLNQIFKKERKKLFQLFQFGS